MTDEKQDQAGFDFVVIEQRRGVIQPSQTCEWSTPPWLFAELDREFRFTVDVAAAPENAKCSRYYTKETNGLAHSWRGERVWCNPPYDAKALTAFATKAYLETRADPDTLAVLLVPSKTDQLWWHEVALRSEVRFIRGRVAFGGLAVTAPMPVCVLVISQHHPPAMRGMIQRQLRLMEDLHGRHR